MRKFLVFLFMTCSFTTESKNSLQPPKKTPFSYDLGIKIIHGKNQQDVVTICCHGYGHNHEIVDIVSSHNVFAGALVGFNFPDHDITPEADHRKIAYGTIDEILPLLYLIKYYACDKKIPKFNLYGFSAGGGAVINALVILNKKLHKDALKKIAISNKEIKQMLAALEQGHIILDCPLKSWGEVIASQGAIPQFEIMSARYKKNNMNPIDIVSKLAGLKLTIILHFQKPDDILGNRDDQLFIKRLKNSNSGNTQVIISSDGGHNSYHAGLWNYYKKQK